MHLNNLIKLTNTTHTQTDIHIHHTVLCRMYVHCTPYTNKQIFTYITLYYVHYTYTHKNRYSHCSVYTTYIQTNIYIHHTVLCTLHVHTHKQIFTLCCLHHVQKNRYLHKSHCTVYTTYTRISHISHGSMYEYVLRTQTDILIHHTVLWTPHTHRQIYSHMYITLVLLTPYTHKHFKLFTLYYVYPKTTHEI